MKQVVIGTLKKKENRWLIAGMVVGILAIICGLSFIFGFKGEVFYGTSSYGTTRLGTATFGADFYTEIYESATFAGNAVKGVYELTSTCFGFLFSLLGAMDICFFGSKLHIGATEEKETIDAGSKEES